jgi:hypothetical protein
MPANGTSNTFPMTGHPLGPGGKGRPLLRFLYAHWEYKMYDAAGTKRNDATWKERNPAMMDVIEFGSKHLRYIYQYASGKQRAIRTQPRRLARSFGRELGHELMNSIRVDCLSLV